MSTEKKGGIQSTLVAGALALSALFMQVAPDTALADQAVTIKVADRAPSYAVLDEGMKKVSHEALVLVAFGGEDVRVLAEEAARMATVPVKHVVEAPLALSPTGKPHFMLYGDGYPSKAATDVANDLVQNLPLRADVVVHALKHFMELSYQEAIVPVLAKKAGE